MISIITAAGRHGSGPKINTFGPTDGPLQKYVEWYNRGDTMASISTDIVAHLFAETIGIDLGYSIISSRSDLTSFKELLSLIFFTNDGQGTRLRCRDDGVLVPDYGPTSTILDGPIPDSKTDIHMVEIYVGEVELQHVIRKLWLHKRGKKVNMTYGKLSLLRKIMGEVALGALGDRSMSSESVMRMITSSKATSLEDLISTCMLQATSVKNAQSFEFKDRAGRPVLTFNARKVTLGKLNAREESLHVAKMQDYMGTYNYDTITPDFLTNWKQGLVARCSIDKRTGNMKPLGFIQEDNAMQVVVLGAYPSPKSAIVTAVYDMKGKTFYDFIILGAVREMGPIAGLISRFMIKRGEMSPFRLRMKSKDVGISDIRELEEFVSRVILPTGIYRSSHIMEVQCGPDKHQCGRLQLMIGTFDYE